MHLFDLFIGSQDIIIGRKNKEENKEEEEEGKKKMMMMMNNNINNRTPSHRMKSIGSTIMQTQGSS